MLRVQAQQLIAAAVDYVNCSGHQECQTAAAAIIAELVGEGAQDWDRAVDAAMFMLHLEVLDKRCWQKGWQPADLARVADRELGAEGRDCVADLMAAQLRAFSPATIDQVWHDQLADLDARVWWNADDEYMESLLEVRGLDRAGAIDLLVRLLALLAQLPRLEMLTPLPGQARGGVPGPRGNANGRSDGDGDVDEKLLARVRALLAKAENTTFAAEAETFTAAAQAMMARHSIDEAMIHRNRRGGWDADRPGGIRLAVDRPYPEAKALLLQLIAEANRCRAVWSKQLGFSTVLGFRAETAWVELLYTSLLVQATSAMAKAGTRTTANGTSRTRAFRAAFLESFAVRIGERLQETTRQAETEAAQAGGQDLLPVLADRSKAVDQQLKRIFPEMWATHPDGWAADGEGWSAGRTAADLADLAHGKAVAAPDR